jgi:hypothetical protein
MHASTHLVRNWVLAAAAAISMVAVAAVAVNGGLATVIALFLLGAVIVLLPLTVIHYDEHDR